MFGIPSEAGVLWDGFGMTVLVAIVSSVLAVIIGIVLAVMRISPIPVLRAGAATYVEIVRNTPLTVVFFICVFVLPQLGLRASFFWLATLSLTAYTCTYFSEVIRSGINAVPRGQVEAARALGMRTHQTLLTVVLPQAGRMMVPPLANTLVIVVKSSSVAGTFGVAELLNHMENLTGEFGSVVLQIIGLTALLYLLICLPVGFIADHLERRWRVSR